MIQDQKNKKLYTLECDDKFHLIDCDHDECAGDKRCKGKRPCEERGCRECCVHDDIKNRVCCDCGMDMTDDYD